MPIATPNAEASSSRRVNKSRRNGVTSEDKPEAEEMTEEHGWTKDTFENRPIEKQGPTLNLLRGMVDRLKDVQRKIEEGMDRAKEAAKSIEDSNPEDEMLDALVKDFKRSIEQRQILEIQVGILDDMINQLRQNRPLHDAANVFKGKSDTLTAEYMAKTSRAKFKDSQDYNEFRSALWEINHPEDACPPISTFLPREEGDASDDDEIEVGGTTQRYTCPISLRPFENAMTCTICNHSYSRDAIYDLITQSAKTHRKSKCPLTGCRAHVTRAVLKDDPTLQKKTDDALKRRKQREAENEDQAEDEDEIS